MPQAKDNNFLHPGTRLGAERQYLILKPLGNGGFGKTYLARNTKFGDGGPQLVIKEFFMLREMHRDEHSSRALVSNPVNQATVNEFRAKFIREAQRIYQLSHPGIVRVTDIIYDENDTSYYVMDYVGGQSLNDLLEQRGVLPEAEAVDYVCQVLEALRVVHANRMLHLDVKPSNIMLNAQGRVVLIDFGASKIENFKGKISSTPMALFRGFASPEQISGSLKHIDPRADIYAVGATLYNLLTLNVVRDPMDLLQDKDAAFAFPLSVSEHVRRAVVRMMAYNSSDRPATVDEALALLRPAAAEFTYADSTADLSLQEMLEMVEVEGGTFTMGATSEQESDAFDNEKPTHHVTLSTFSIGKYEVTQALWQEIMGSNPSEFKGDLLPVENVSWNDCQEFLRKLNARKGEFGVTDGRTFRLPTEAEWEYAARGGKLSKGFKYSGSNNIGDVAWYWDNSGDKTHPVGTKQPNELGIYDMSGNVWEWCQDWYDGYSSGAQTNPQGSASGSLRVYRGGCWDFNAHYCRVSYRCNFTPDFRLNCLGLRLVLKFPYNSSDRPATVDEALALLRTAAADFTYADSTADLSLQEMLEMVEVEGGTFTMGVTSEQGSDADDDEKPAHQVTLSTFSIGKYEVTQALWQEIMGSNPSCFKGDNLPVENVSWDDCQEFLRKLNARKGEFGITDGRTFRLPTEAEWEYAARGGKLSKGFKYSGSNNIGDVAWCDENSGYKTHPVGTKQANELGIYDMSGNVYEWCQDWYGGYSSGAQTNPRGPALGSSRVNRGGGWFSIAQNGRVSCRNSSTPDSRHSDLGLRLVLNSDRPATVDEALALLRPAAAEFTYADSTADLSLQEMLEMVEVEGGTFTMGATSEQESDAFDKEKPAHQVTLSTFSIGKYEVTQALWQEIMGSNPSYFKGDNLPVENVSWNDCQEFLRKLNARKGEFGITDGRTFRLPTEAEWEYAARGGKLSKGFKYSGSNNIGDVAWYWDNSGEKSHPVGTKQANELGFYDMSGNVHEWCQDWYGDYSSGAQTNPQGPASGSYRVFRGGSWNGIARLSRVSSRFNYCAPDYRYNFLGLRLVLKFP